MTPDMAYNIIAGVMLVVALWLHPHHSDSEG